MSDLARAIHRHVKKQTHSARHVHRGVVKALEPALRVQLVSDDRILDVDDDFDLGGWARLYDREWGIAVDDNVLLHEQNDEWVLFDVISDSSIKLSGGSSLA